MPRGGRRPGAGAPKGNMNALKSGRYSPHFNAVRAALSQRPGRSRPTSPHSVVSGSAPSA